MWRHVRLAVTGGRILMNVHLSLPVTMRAKTKHRVNMKGENTMKVKDLLPMEIDVDVYDDVCEELAIAFCGPIKLTTKGELYFAEVLEYEIDFIKDKLYGDTVIVHVDSDDWEIRLGKATELFHAMAGYCSVSDYERWFTDE